MRIVILSSGIYSETATAMAAHLSADGYVPVGALALSTFNRQTLVRKIGQWGLPKVFKYARSKMFSSRTDGAQPATNPYLAAMLQSKRKSLRNLREVGAHYGFPIAVCKNQNDSTSIAQLQQWAPDLLVFAGGNILRKTLLAAPQLGVLNIHLGILPEIKGMSSPEWSLLTNVPVGITIHFMDAGIDTGPILQTWELPNANHSDSLTDLRHRLIAFGIERLVEVIYKLERGIISATSQSKMTADVTQQDFLGEDRQFFVMHDRLRDKAQKILTASQPFRATNEFEKAIVHG